MRSSVEPLDGNRVRLSIEVEEAEFDRAMDAAFRKIAREIRVPGFRPGKAPRRLIEARLGRGVARQEALREALPEYYDRAVADNAITPIAPPEIEITAGEEEGPIAFDAVVEVMPQVSVGGYEGLRVVLPSIEVGDDDVRAHVDRLREQFGELRTVARPARDGDHVSIDRKVTRHDEVLLAADDELYEVGKGTVVPELDRELRGKRAGDILKFNATTADHGEVTFTVLVKEVRETVLPEVTDDWASEASEFDTVAELEADIRRRLETIKRLQAAMMLRDRVIEALVELVDDEMPEALVRTELERRVNELQHRLSHQNMTVAQYLEATGLGEQDLLLRLQAEAVVALKADLALQAVAEIEAIEVSDEELEQGIREMAERRGEKADALRKRLQSGGELPAVRSGLRKTKAMEWLVEHTEYVDEDGRVIDRSDLEPPPTEASPGQEDSSDAAIPAEETVQ
ncbi:MAG TPA: trigger factor [Acidimicrobiales bacterium]|nr:trigger factor [Acidimicrobiales bacterium]